METKEQQINNLKEYVVQCVLEADTESKRKDSVIRAWSEYVTAVRSAYTNQAGSRIVPPCAFCHGPHTNISPKCGYHGVSNMPCFRPYCTERLEDYVCSCGTKWNCNACTGKCCVCSSRVCITLLDAGGNNISCGAQCESCDAVYCCNNNNKAKHENVCSVCNSDKCPVCNAHFCAPAKEKRKRERQDQQHN